MKSILPGDEHIWSDVINACSANFNVHAINVITLIFTIILRSLHMRMYISLARLKW